MIEAVRNNPKKYSDYSITDNQLYRHKSRNCDTIPWKLCVPGPLRERVLKENHDSATAGHLGVRKTGDRIANRYIWPGMFRDIKKYLSQCESGQKYKVSQQKRSGEMLQRISEELWATICADFVGPLSRSKHGCTMLLVIFDRFSKWKELIPLRKSTSEGVIRACRERIISRYGVPPS